MLTAVGGGGGDPSTGWLHLPARESPIPVLLGTAALRGRTQALMLAWPCRGGDLVPNPIPAARKQWHLPSVSLGVCL